MQLNLLLERKGTSTPIVDASAYIALIHLFRKNITSRSEIKLQASKRWILQQSVFQLSPESIETLAQALEFNRDHLSWSAGVIFARARGSRSILLAELRYCAICLHEGWHSVVFQHPGLRICPVHRKPLRMGCPHCQEPILTTICGILRNHFYCESCGRRLDVNERASTEPNEKGPTHGDGAAFDLVRRALLPAAYSTQKTSYDVKAGARCDRSDRQSHPYAKHEVWSETYSDAFRLFKSEKRFFVNEGDFSAPAVDKLAFNSAYAVLVEIRDRFCQTWPLALPNAALLSWSCGDQRTDQACSLISSAFWMTARAFLSIRRLRGERLVDLSRVTFPHFVPVTPGATEFVVRAQVFALLASYMLVLRKFTYSVEISWGGIANECRWIPAWVVYPRRFEGTICIELRHSVSEKTVWRLLARYAKRELLRTPPHLDPIEVAAGAKSSWDW